MKRKFQMILRINLLLMACLILLHGASAQITINSFTSNPEAVQPGEKMTIKLNIENIGEEDIENVVISLDLTSLPFAPIDSSSEKVIEKIKDNEEEAVTFNVEALANAEPSIYNIPVTISYENTTKVSLISIEVNTDASLNVLLEDSDLVVTNEQGKITLKFVNSGLTKIKFLQATLLESAEYEILSPNSVYIGEVDIGDFETEEFVILPKTENPSLLLKLEYRDANNKEFVEQKQVDLTVYTIEEAKALGLLEEKHTATIILGIVVLIIGIAVFYKKKRKKHA